MEGIEQYQDTARVEQKLDVEVVNLPVGSGEPGLIDVPPPGVIFVPFGMAEIGLAKGLEATANVVQLELQVFDVAINPAAFISDLSPAGQCAYPRKRIGWKIPSFRVGIDHYG